MTMSPITTIKTLLPITAPSAPAPKPKRTKHTEIPATNNALFTRIRSLRQAAVSGLAAPLNANCER